LTCKPSNEIASPGRYWDARTRARLRHRRAAAGGQTENAEKRAAKKAPTAHTAVISSSQMAVSQFSQLYPRAVQFTSEPYHHNIMSGTSDHARLFPNPIRSIEST